MADAVIDPPAAVAAAVAAPTSWANADGTFAPSFYETLPEDIRGLKDDIAKFKSPSELARAYAHNKHFAGQKGLIPLDVNAPKEAREARKVLMDGLNGVPKEAKEYGLTRPADIPEKAWDAAYIDKVQAWAHENSISPGVMKKLVSDIVTPQVKASLANQEAEGTAFYNAQEQAFAAAIKVENMPLDKANALAERGATALGLDLTKQADAALLKLTSVKLAMMRHAIAVGEDSYVAGEAERGEGQDAEALAKDAAQNPANPLHAPLFDSKHPQHKMAKEKVDQWWRAAAAKRNRGQA